MIAFRLLFMSIAIVYTIIFVLFILHELEEIYHFKHWFNKNNSYLKEQFPRLGNKMIRQFKHISTKGFAFIAFEETIILLTLLLYAFYRTHPGIGMGVVLMLSIHWTLTIIQSLFIRRIIPGTYTAILGVCFSMHTFISFTDTYPFTLYIKYGIILFIFAMVNLAIMHILVAGYMKSKNNTN